MATSHVTLAFTENNAGTQGVLTVADGFGDTARITLLGQYATTDFAKAADSGTGTRITTSHQLVAV